MWKVVVSWAGGAGIQDFKGQKQELSLIRKRKKEQ